MPDFRYTDPFIPSSFLFVPAAISDFEKGVSSSIGPPRKSANVALTRLLVQLIPFSAILVSEFAEVLGLEASSKSWADNRSFRASSTGPNTWARNFDLLVLTLLDRRPFAIVE